MNKDLCAKSQATSKMLENSLFHGPDEVEVQKSVLVVDEIIFFAVEEFVGKSCHALFALLNIHSAITRMAELHGCVSIGVAEADKAIVVGQMGFAKMVIHNERRRIRLDALQEAPCSHPLQRAFGCFETGKSCAFFLTQPHCLHEIIQALGDFPNGCQSV